VEDEILRMEAALPGLGGLFVDGRGDVVVFVPGNQNATSARAILAAQAGRLNLSDRVLAALRTGEKLEVRHGDYSFSTLVAWTEALAPRLGNIKGIIAIDADEALNRVRVTMSNENLSEQVLRAASAAGVPGAAITTSVGLTPVPLASLRGTWRPTGGGVQIINAGGGRCTLGFNVSSGTGTVGFLTASHCDPSSTGSGSVGANIYQPIVGSAYVLGQVNANPAFNYSDPSCMGYTLCTRADVMFVRYNTPSNGPTRVAITDFAGFNNSGGSITVTGWWNNVASPAAAPVVGEQIHKMGWLTGWTAGTLAATCESPLVGNSYVVVCAGKVVTARAGMGDSGSPVFIPPAPGRVNDPLWRQGILFAGSGNFVWDTNDSTYICNANCSYWYSQWWQIEAHFGTAMNAS
jgi:hypothetical protein